MDLLKKILRKKGHGWRSTPETAKWKYGWRNVAYEVHTQRTLLEYRATVLCATRTNLASIYIFLWVLLFTRSIRFSCTLWEKRTEIENKIMKMIENVYWYCIVQRKSEVKMKEIQLYMRKKTFTLSWRAGAGQQLATSYLWVAVFLLNFSPSSSVLLLPLSS